MPIQQISTHFQHILSHDNVAHQFTTEVTTMQEVVLMGA